MELKEVLLKVKIEWQLNDSQLADLLHVDKNTLADYWNSSETSATVPASISSAMPLASIYLRLCQVIPDAADRMHWLDQPHSAFGGTRPMEVMLSSPDNLAWVSYFLAHAPARMPEAVVSDVPSKE